MPTTTSTLTLAVRELGTAPNRSLFFHVFLNDQVIAGNQALSVADAQKVCRFADEFNSLFEQLPVPPVTAERMKAYGEELFALWLGPVWDKIQPWPEPGGAGTLLIASDVPAVLNLPWEILRPPGGDPLGCDARYGIRRLPRSDPPRLTPSRGPLPPRPLRVLLQVCAPVDQPSLDYEREEEGLLQAVTAARPGHAVCVSGDLGTFKELEDHVNFFRPHVVHLVGHGSIDGDEHFFSFEDERGETDDRPARALAGLFAGSGVQCVFVSGCQTGTAPPVAVLGGLCQRLVGQGAPLAVGWAASVADDLAISFARTFNGVLAAGRPADRALAQGREEARQQREPHDDPAWALPVLYAATDQGPVYDPDPRRPEEPPPRPGVEQAALPGMTEGYAEHFVGRRRELQELLPALRAGTYQVVLLTGIGGAGKSTLATRLARRLEADGFTPIPVPSTSSAPLRADQLLKRCGDAFLQARSREDCDTLNDSALAVDARLRYLVGALNRGRFVLVLDNFEVNLDESTRRVLDPELAGFYAHLLANLSGKSRALITCRYPPADVGPLPPRALAKALADFPEAAFFKFLVRDPDVERRYQAGELPHELLQRLHNLLGGTPRFLGQVRKVLRDIAAADLWRALEDVRLPAAAAADPLRRERDRYCEQIFTARLYDLLPPAARRALSRAAVFAVPVNREGLAAVTGAAEKDVGDFTRQWRDHALAHADGAGGVEERWTVYGLLRGWLTAPERLPPQEFREAHRAAGDFLHELVKQDREGDLGLSDMACEMEARAHYLAAEDLERARRATSIVSECLVRGGFFAEAEGLNRELLGREHHPEPALWVGRARLNRGDEAEARVWYQRCLEAAGALPLLAAAALQALGLLDLRHGNPAAAREKYAKALDLARRAEDGAGEASCWHGLGRADMAAGDDEAARQKLLKALEIWQRDRQGEGPGQGEGSVLHLLAALDVKIHDFAAALPKLRESLRINQEVVYRSAEALNWRLLAELAQKSGRGTVAAARLQAVCVLIEERIRHGDADEDRLRFDLMVGQLCYTRQQTDDLLRLARASYESDRGRALFDAAFPPE